MSFQKPATLGLSFLPSPDFFGQIVAFHLFEFFCGKICSFEKLAHAEILFFFFLGFKRILEYTGILITSLLCMCSYMKEWNQFL